MTGWLAHKQAFVFLAAVSICVLGYGGSGWWVAFSEALTIPYKDGINAAVAFLSDVPLIGELTFKDMVRIVAAIILIPLDLLRGLLVNGFEIGQRGAEGSFVLPPLSWISVLGLATLAGYFMGRTKIAILTALAMFYFLLIGYRESAMETLAAILIAVPTGAVLGIVVGVLAYFYRWVELLLKPILDLLQTVPPFAYLVPILVFFGFGPVSSFIATLLVATPPMIRVVILGLRQVDTSLMDLSAMMGCSRWQHLRKILLPAIRPSIIIGSNQVVLFSLNMVMITSLIGAGGLGFDVLRALRQVRIGEALEAGLAITILAILLDRANKAFSQRLSQAQTQEKITSDTSTNRILLVLVGLFAALYPLGMAFPVLTEFPEHLTFSTKTLLDDMIAAFTNRFYDQINVVKFALVLNVMNPLRDLLLNLPWLGVVVFIVGTVWRVAGILPAFVTALLWAVIVTSGLWTFAMQSIYLSTIAAALCVLIGVPLGILSTSFKWAYEPSQVVMDTFQTLPQFVYLLPAIMIFGIGDFSAILAIVAFAFVFAWRYTVFGIRSVPDDVLEAASMAGASRFQTLWKVQVPIAFPILVLGFNQVINMSVAMLSITALIGTRDLGQQIFLGLGYGDVGQSLVAGLCMAVLSITANTILSRVAERKRRELGMS